MSDNVIYHDFSQPEMDIVFTPEAEEPLFTGSYDVQPCFWMGSDTRLFLDEQAIYTSKVLLKRVGSETRW